MRRSLLPQQLVRRAVVIASLATACSSQQPAQASGSATVHGSLGGRTMDVAYAVATRIGDPNGHQMIVVIGNDPQMCAILQTDFNDPTVRQAGLFQIGLVLGRAGATAVVGPGTYTETGNPNELVAAYGSYDAACVASGSTAMTGTETVTLTSVGAAYVGTFDVTFPGGEVSGSFDAPLCDLTPTDGDASVTPDGGVTCVAADAG